MAIISPDRGYLFIQVPRTGCTAVAEKVLIPQLDGEHLLADDVRDHDGRIRISAKHAPLEQLLAEGIIDAETRRSLFVFATVRNPFDSVLSEYTKMRRVNAEELSRPGSWVHHQDRVARSVARAAELPFEEWVAWQYGRQPWRRRVRAAVGIRAGIPVYYRGVDAVMRFERLQADFDAVVERLGADGPIAIPQYNRTSGRPDDYREHYSRRSRRIVERAFAGVFAHFGYRF